MKSTKPILSILTVLLLGSLYAVPTIAADVNTTGGVDAAVPGVNATTSGNATVTTPADPSMPATPADPADRLEKRTDGRAVNRTDNSMKGTNMRNKDCDVNVSANSNSNSRSSTNSTNATKNCDDTSKPRK